MTQKQADIISSYIDTMSEEEANLLFEELIAGMSIYFGTVYFGETIDNYFNLEGEKNLKTIAEKVKSITIKEDKIIAALLELLKSTEESAENFASDCSISIAFNPNYPKSLVEELDKNEIEISDFNSNLIFTFRDQFVDFFLNEISIKEWAGDIIDALVVNWA